jgi:hypothetical protein
MGQSIRDFAISTLCKRLARFFTISTSPDSASGTGNCFAAMLDDESSKPNDALVKAAKGYKKQVG